MSTLIVTGLGRCGTTAVMHMLAAAGANVVGRAPDFEVEAAHRPSAEWYRAKEGRAVKILNPHRMPDFLLNDEGAVFILLTRDAEMQALSQMKLVQAAGYSVQWDRASRRKATSAVARETQASIQRLKKSGRPVLRLTFEHLLTRRQAAARAIAEFLRPYAELDDRKMWPEIWLRSTDCLPDLMEEELLAMAPYLQHQGAAE